MKIAILGSYSIYNFATELESDPKSVRRITSWNETLASSLAKRPDVEVHFITGSKSIPGTRTLRKERLAVTYLVTPPKLNMFSLFQYTRWKVHRMLDEIGPDLVHGIGTEHIWPYVAVTSHLPTVITVHGVMSEIIRKVPTPITSRKRLFSWLERWVLRRTQHLISISPYVEQMAKKYTAAQTYSVENPVNAIFSRHTAKPENGKYVLFVGSIESCKGLDILIESLAQFGTRPGNQPPVIIVGSVTEQSYEIALRRQIEAHALTDSIHFRGFLLPNELADLYANAALLVLPSRQETAPLCIAEAMAAGLPVVASNVGGVAHMIDDGGTGFLVEPGDVETLSAKLETLWHNADLRRQMGERGREVARQRWRPELIAEQTEEVYRQVCQTHR